MKSLLPTPNYHVKHKRNGRILAEGIYKNTLTDEGIEAIARRGFDQDPTLNWFLSLIDGPIITSVRTDTAAVHAGWTEFKRYKNLTRPEWLADTYAILPAFGDDIEVSNSELLTFQVEFSGSVRGIFAISDAAKGGSVGKLLSIVDFGITHPVLVGDEIEVTFTFGFNF